MLTSAWKISILSVVEYPAWTLYIKLNTQENVYIYNRLFKIPGVDVNKLPGQETEVELPYRSKHMLCFYKLLTNPGLHTCLNVSSNCPLHSQSEVDIDQSNLLNIYPDHCLSPRVTYKMCCTLWGIHSWQARGTVITEREKREYR